MFRAAVRVASGSGKAAALKAKRVREGVMPLQRDARWCHARALKSEHLAEAFLSLRCCIRDTVGRQLTSSPRSLTIVRCSWMNGFLPSRTWRIGFT